MDQDDAHARHWFKVEILNCKIEANSSRPRNQIRHIFVRNEQEARQLAPRVWNSLFSEDTYLGTVTLFV